MCKENRFAATVSVEGETKMLHTRIQELRSILLPRTPSPYPDNTPSPYPDNTPSPYPDNILQLPPIIFFKNQPERNEISRYINQESRDTEDRRCESSTRRRSLLSQDVPPISVLPDINVHHAADERNPRSRSSDTYRKNSDTAIITDREHLAMYKPDCSRNQAFSAEHKHSHKVKAPLPPRKTYVYALPPLYLTLNKASKQ